MTQTGSLSAHGPFHRECFCCQAHSHVRDLADPAPGSSSISLPTCMLSPWAPSLETSSLLSSPPSSICGHHCGLRPAVIAKPSLLSFLLTAVMRWRLRRVMSPNPIPPSNHTTLWTHTPPQTQEDDKAQMTRTDGLSYSALKCKHWISLQAGFIISAFPGYDPLSANTCRRNLTVTNKSKWWKVIKYILSSPIHQNHFV